MVLLFDDINLKLTLKLETNYSFEDFKFELSDESLFGQAIRSMNNFIISQPENGYCLSPVT